VRLVTLGSPARSALQDAGFDTVALAHRPHNFNRRASLVKKAVLYYRASQFDQDAARARRELEVAADRLNYDVAMVTEDRARPGGTNRPGLNRLMYFASIRSFRAVLAWRLAGFGSSTWELVTNIIRLVEDYGVRFVVVRDGLDIRADGDATSRALLGALHAIQDFELDLIRVRTRLGLAAAKKRGARLGRPANPAPPASEVRKRRARGDSWSQVAHALGCSIGKARRLVAASA
jgi:DNA invertase Pin-like site-specific DNA recombinase